MGELAAAIAAAAAAVTAIAAVVPEVKTTWAHFMSKYRSSNSTKEINDALNATMGVLRAKMADYQNEVHRHKSKIPSETYNQWICRVMEIEEQVQFLASKYEKKRKKSSFCLLPHMDLSKKMKKKDVEAAKLLEESEKLGDFMLVDQPPDVVVKMRTPKVENYPTLQEPLEEILKLLRNDKIKGVGIRGMVGIGKTTIMKNLNNHEEVSKLFEIVIWLRLSTEGSLENLSKEHIQQAIVQRLELDIPESSDGDRVARTISKELEEKKYLLLLDDVKEDVDLGELGIPDGKCGSKLVLTTRLGYVCSSMANRVVNVKNLSQEEAWKMFRDTLQRPDLMDNPHIERLAWQVVKLCGGLPLVIKLVGSAFKMKKSNESWAHGLNNLRKWPEKEHQGMREMYKMLKFCYDSLTGDQKNCFLYSSLYAEDSDIYTQCLLESWIAEYFRARCHDVRAYGHGVLEHLENMSLLEEGASTEYVRMHKCIRQMALNILSDMGDRRYMVKARETPTNPEIEENWNEMEWISLIDNELQNLPDQPGCSILSTLFLQKNTRLNKIPQSFFKDMQSLRVLDLYCTGIESLPTSVSNLLNLKVLYLNDCKALLELPSKVFGLEHLEVLDIRGSGIKSIPAHIHKFVCLKHLRASFSNDIQEAALNCKVISTFTTLEELMIDVKTNKASCNDMLDYTIENVATLNKLKIFQFRFIDCEVDVIKVVGTAPYICVPKAGSFISLIGKRDDILLSSFRVAIGRQPLVFPQIPNFYQYDRYVKHCSGQDSDPPISCVLSRADAFELVNHNGAEQLWRTGITSMNQLQGCLIENCEGISTIVNGNCRLDKPILPIIGWFCIRNLPSLKSILDGPVLLGSLSRLETLIISKCPMLVEIFTNGLVQQLLRLQHLEIEGCFGIEEVIKKNDIAGLRPCALQNLQEVILLDMPNLRSIWVDESLEWPFLERLEILRCPSLKRLPFSNTNAPKLSYISTEQDWWEALQWQRQEAKEQFQQYCTFR
ncbi:hypothetical protein RJ640_002679 [Escallonia rubra]|uniref:NB-ARC domain-containing protein n=1 Tax=Escallonia rubra TaxID=112253 RepID=A0AA88QJ20_9ASTE|nr:hypothetical protein RJ640_002679 [Escallonia rubra]